MKLRTSLFLLLSLPMIAMAQGNGKKVYADYHGVRYSRVTDGKWGRWEMYANTEKSATSRKSLCYNTDLIDNTGKHEIAAANYPIVGIHSNLDHDYIEYQILSAKVAKIDGFFIEWGFMPHENDVLLKAMQKVAQKYNFEIGVNWCDGWLYYNWITKIYPEIQTREDKTEYMAKCYQYLIDNVFSGPTAPIVKGMPVFYHFGAGAKTDEFAKVLSMIKLPEGMAQPVALRRWADWGTLENDKYMPVRQSDDMDQWKTLGEIPTAWLPARVRPMDEAHPNFDHYATLDDMIEFMKPFRDSIWNNTDMGYKIKSGFAMPGMDNSGCAGWGRGHFFYMPRNEGETYRKMWEFSMESKDKLDMMFIASWSDYTEGHEIEPTFENGDRELKTTLQYAAEFKNEKADERGIALPLALFNLRKESQFLKDCHMETSVLDATLDRAAQCISTGRYAAAYGMLSKMANDVNMARQALQPVPMRLRDTQLEISGKHKGNAYNISETMSIRLPKQLVSDLNMNNHEGFIYFEYLDKGKEYFFVRSSTKKTPKDIFNVVAKVRTNDTGEWKKAKIELNKENITYMLNSPTFYLKGNTMIRNLSLGYNIYKIK